MYRAHFVGSVTFVKNMFHLNILIVVYYLQVALNTEVPDHCLDPRPSADYCNSIKPRCLGKREARMANAEQVKTAAEFPHLVRIFCQETGGSMLKVASAGTLIHDRFALTAAHCIEMASEVSYNEIHDIKMGWTIFATMGRNNIRIKTNAFEAHAARTIYPQEYRQNETDFDIALLELRETVPFSKYIIPACLPQAYNARRNTLPLSASIVGWGARDNASSNLEDFILRKGTVNIWGPAECCSARYTPQECASDNRVEIICTKSTSPNTCHGDAGSPLSFKNQTYDECNRPCIRHSVLGVVFRKSYECNLARVEPYYSVNVWDFIDWIESYIWPI